jgi:hypothetical protein
MNFLVTQDDNQEVVQPGVPIQEFPTDVCQDSREKLDPHLNHEQDMEVC